MLGVDIEKLIKPFVEGMNVMADKLDKVIQLLEEVSKKLDEK